MMNVTAREDTSWQGKTRYAAFISYSHADSAMCDRLHKRLESYVIPYSLVGQEGPHGKMGKRLGKCFRDRVDLGAHHDLGAEIREALDQSAALIVLCSPKSAGSKYVEEEIRYFKSLGRAKQVFAAIISGEPHAAGKPGLSASDECFPRALVYCVGANGSLTTEPEPSEPIAADLRDKKDGMENGALKLVAGLLDMGLDDLVQREKQAEARRRRQAYLVSSIMGVLAICAGVGGVLAWLNGETAAKRSQELVLANAELDTRARLLKQGNDALQAANSEIAAKLQENKTLTARVTSVVDEISTIAQNDPNIPEQVLLLSYAAAEGMSAQSLELYLKDSFPPGKMVFPTIVTESSLCLGSNCLIRGKSDQSFLETWSSFLTPPEVKLISSVNWQDKNLRVDLVPGLGEIRVSRREALRAAMKDLPRYATMARSQFPNTANLHPDCIGALISLAMATGTGGVMSAIGPELKQSRFSDIPAALRTRGDMLAARGGNWERQRQRFHEQADLFEKGLAAMASVSAKSP